MASRNELCGMALLQEEMQKKVEKWQEPPPAKQTKVLPVPDMQPKKRRGGKRYRKMKERYGLTGVCAASPIACHTLQKFDLMCQQCLLLPLQCATTCVRPSGSVLLVNPIQCRGTVGHGVKQCSAQLRLVHGSALWLCSTS